MNSDNTPRQNAMWPGAAANPLSDWRFAHEYYDTVREWLWDRIDSFDEPIIAVVIGATGTGKSTLRKQLQREIVKRRSPELEANPGVVPFVFGETVFHPRVGVDWAGLFREWLGSAGEPMVDRKVDPEGKRGGSLPALHSAVTNMLRHRRPSIALVDEASVLLGSSGSSTSAIEANVNYLKGLCNRSQTHLGLFGDYGLAKLAQISGQLDRRCHYAHLPPYPDVCADFLATLKAFEKRFADQGIDADLSANAELLFSGSLGAIGLLRDWLVEASIKVRYKRAPISKAVLLETHFPEAKINKWRSELQEGFARIAWMKNIAPGSIFDPKE